MLQLEITKTRMQLQMKALEVKLAITIYEGFKACNLFFFPYQNNNNYYFLFVFES